MKVLISDLIIRLTAFMMTMSKKTPFFARLTLSNEIAHEARMAQRSIFTTVNFYEMACNVDRSPPKAVAMSTTHLSIARGGDGDFAMLTTSHCSPAMIFYSSKD